MNWALGLSLLLHALVLSVQLGVPESTDRLMRDAGLEVILVNTILLAIEFDGAWAARERRRWALLAPWRCHTAESQICTH